ncbi:ATP-binding protein [Polaromonas glacialis]|uniref:ATP-binding protein n=1 Tax=Polaromonas glacialis TaxID=866564 RepID=UPI000496780D
MRPVHHNFVTPWSSILPRLTERFCRVERCRSRGTGSTGLAIARHVTQRHGAELRIDRHQGAGFMQAHSARMASATWAAATQLSSPDAMAGRPCPQG